MPPTTLPRVALRWTPQKERQTKGDLEENSKERDEGTGMDLGIPGKMCDRQTMVESSGGGLIYTFLWGQFKLSWAGSK